MCLIYVRTVITRFEVSISLSHSLSLFLEPPLLMIRTRRKWSQGNRLDDSPSNSRPEAGYKPRRGWDRSSTLWLASERKLREWGATGLRGWRRRRWWWRRPKAKGRTGNGGGEQWKSWRSINRHPADPRQGHGRGLHPRDTVSSPLGGRRTIIRTIRNRRRLTAAAGDERGARDVPLSFHPMVDGVKGRRKECSMKVALSARECRALFVTGSLILVLNSFTILFFPYWRTTLLVLVVDSVWMFNLLFNLTVLKFGFKLFLIELNFFLIW